MCIFLHFGDQRKQSFRMNQKVIESKSIWLHRWHLGSRGRLKEIFFMQPLAGPTHEIYVWWLAALDIQYPPMWPWPLQSLTLAWRSQQLDWEGDLLEQRHITIIFPCLMISMLSGLSLALNKEGCDWQDRHSSRANTGRGTHLSQTRYTPLVEVNQAIKAWTF